MGWELLSIISNMAFGVIVIFLTRSVTKYDKKADEREKNRVIELWFAAKTGDLAQITANVIYETDKRCSLKDAITDYQSALKEMEKAKNKMMGGV